jgi:hypothetical protein
MAKKLNVSRGYINQVLNVNFNFTLKKLIELSLAMNKIPLVKFEKINPNNSVMTGHSENGNTKKFVKSKKEVVRQRFNFYTVTQFDQPCSQNRHTRGGWSQ